MQRLLFVMKTHTYRAGAFLEAAESLHLQVAIGSETEHVLSRLTPGSHLQLDFQDPEAATDAIVNFADHTPVQGIIAPEDDGAILAAMASDSLGLSADRLPGVAAARNKFLMRQVLADGGLPTPWFQRFPVDSDPAAVSGRVPYPCVVKPLSLSGSRGVLRTDDPAAFQKAFLRVRNILLDPEIQGQEGAMAHHLLVESYIPGTEVAVEGILSEGHLQVLAIFDKPDPLEGPYFEETIYVTPSRLPADQQGALIEATAAGAAALGIRNGPVHAELRLNMDGVWIIEVAPRSIGGYCSKALRFSEGNSLETLILRQAIGEDITSILREDQASGVMMIPIPASGILHEVHGQDEAGSAEGISEIILTIPPGQPVLQPPEGNQYLGFIFARGESPGEVENSLRTAHAHLHFDIRPAGAVESLNLSD